MPRGDQGEHAPRQEQNGLAAPDPRQDGVPHDLPSRPAYGLALWDEGFAEGVQENLVISYQSSVISSESRMSSAHRVIPSVARNLALVRGGRNQSEIPLPRLRDRNDTDFAES